VSLLLALVFDGGRFYSGCRHLPAMMNDGNGGTINGSKIKGGI